MQIFSQEYLDQLVAEHKFVTAAIRNMKRQGWGQAGDSPDQNRFPYLGPAMNELNVQRLILESKIEVLQDYLN